MATIKKAQNGATKDSTEYFKGRAKDMARKSLYAEAKGDKKLSNVYMDAASKSSSDASRQANKGKKGYDKNGYPLKKKMQTGGAVKTTKKSVPMSVAKKKVDSLNYDSATRRKAGMERTVGPKGYDDISKKLMEGARKSDSISKNWQRGIEKAKKAKGSKK
jgi:hypothetical protein